MTVHIMCQAFGSTEHPGRALEALKGRYIIDLACGIHPEQVADQLSFNGATGYIGVDRHQFTKLVPNKNGIPAIVLNCDALDYLKTLPSGSCNVTIHGLDTWIISNFARHLELAREAARVCAIGGAVFGALSTALQIFRSAILGTEPVEGISNGAFIALDNGLSDESGFFLRVR